MRAIIDAYIKQTDRENYETEIKSLKNKEGKWSDILPYKSLINNLKDIIRAYKQDGQDIYEQFVSEINETNYPTEIKEKILAEIKNDLFSQQPSENKKEPNKEELKEKEEIKEVFISLKIPTYLFYNGTYDYENIKEIGEKLSNLPLDMQKKIIRNYGDVLDYFTNPSKELCLYAIENKYARIPSVPKEYRNNDLDIQLAIIEKTPDFSKKTKLLPQARIEYIKKYPDEIITEITKENYRERNKFTIYDLSNEELKIYKESLEKHLLNKVKNDPTSIKEIKNPSKLVVETALTVLKEQYTR